MTATVLVVEDDELIASSLVRALQSKGYEASSTPTVAAAIASITQATPDLVLLDLGLPDGDGDEVCTVVARHHPEVPVIVLTARREEADVVLGLEMGAADYVVKPFRLAELLARVAAQLRAARRRADAAGRHDRETVDRRRARSIAAPAACTSAIARCRCDRRSSTCSSGSLATPASSSPASS